MTYGFAPTCMHKKSCCKRLTGHADSKSELSAEYPGTNTCTRRVEKYVTAIMAEGRFFGADQFNPRLITTQIVVMQSSFWFCLGAAVALADWLLSEETECSPAFFSPKRTLGQREGDGFWP